MLEIIVTYWHIFILFFLIAILYSSIGFGGGSSYLAILALTSFAYSEIRSTALLCNIVVVCGNVFLFSKQKSYNWKKTLPLVTLSVPLAFLGGFLKINETLFFILLGFTLLIAALFMLFSNKTSKTYIYSENNLLKNTFYGGLIGFISGVVGIGGGVFLAPLLYLTNWDTSKKIAATASFFILVNSLSGIIGQYYNPDFNINWDITITLLFIVFLGGQIGSRLSNKLLSANQLKKSTALLVAFVGLRILIKSLYL